MRFEILGRDGLARIGQLDIDGNRVTTPALAFIDTDRYPAPQSSLRVRDSMRAGKGDIRIAASEFSSSRSAADERAHIRPGTRGSPYVEDTERSEFAFLPSASEALLDSSVFAEGISKIKTGADLLRPTYCSTLGMPHRLALLAYCGMDVFDSLPLIMSAENGGYLTSSGSLDYERLVDLPCSCPACSSGRRGKEELLRHNYHAAADELKLVRHSIAEGYLRELVEARVRSEPWQVQSLRLLDLNHYDLLEAHTAVKGPRFHAGSKESLSRPDVVRWRRRLEKRYRRPAGARVLLLIPCSAKKPYSLSQSHMRFREALERSGRASAVHEVIVTSPLGLVPRELEMFYPAKDYDIPVTGHWDRDEMKMVEDLVTWLVRTQHYESVISHLGDERDVVNSVLGDFVDTSAGNPGSRESLGRLERALHEKVTGDAPSWGVRALDDMRSLCEFQFGPAGRFLCEGSRIWGRWPELHISRGETQLGMLTRDRGMISLTLDGGADIAKENAYCVEIEDFVPKGNLFAVGIEHASAEVRIGDDVAIVHNGDVRAVGVAKMGQAEMSLAERGEAVHIRHVLPLRP